MAGLPSLRLVAAASALVLLLSGEEGGCAEARGSLDISARVVARAVLESLGEPESLTVTEEDIRQGFMEAPADVLLSIRSTPRRGYILAYSLDDWIAGVSIRGLAMDAQIRGREGWLFQPSPQAARVQVAVRYRFLLRPETLPGRYPWPLRTSVAPAP